MVDAHLPVVPREGEGKQRRDGPQPEQQVQREGQPAQSHTPAQRPHPVVNQPQQHTQQQPLPKNGRLGRNVHIHGQRSSREKNPPRPPPSSS